VRGGGSGGRWKGAEEEEKEEEEAAASVRRGGRRGIRRGKHFRCYATYYLFIPRLLTHYQSITGAFDLEDCDLLRYFSRENDLVVGSINNS